MGKQDTKLKLLQAFTELVVENGYQAATTIKIAQLAGVNESSLFRLFGNKKGLLLALIAQCVHDIDNLQNEQLEQLELSECLFQVAQQYQTFMRTHEALVMVGLKESLQLEEVKEATNKLAVHFKKVVETILIQRIQTGEITKKINPKIQADNFNWLNFGYFLTQHNAHNSKVSEPKRTDFLREHIHEYLRGIL